MAAKFSLKFAFLAAMVLFVALFGSVASIPLGEKAGYTIQSECRTAADCARNCFCDSGICFCREKLFNTNTDQKMSYKGDPN
uniref:Defensin-like protein n=1 Tax=Cucumis melo TaxID=3656 RepID=A0A9I9EA46_CUCME